MVICAMVGCGNRSNRDKGKSFFRLPSVITNQDTETKLLTRRRQKTWFSKIKRADITPKQYYNIRVCSDHFVSGVPAKLYDVNNTDWAPSVKLRYGCASGKTSLDVASQRNERAQKRRRLCDNSNFIEISTVDTSIDTGNELELQSESHVIESTGDNGNEANDVDHVVHTSSIAVQTDPLQGLEDIKKYQDKIEELKNENETLKKNVHFLELELKERYINEEYFKDNDKKVLFYTGLGTWSLLMALFTYIKPFLNDTGNSSLSSFQQLLLTLMRLRLNLNGQDLAYRFNVHNSTVSRIFLRVIEVLHVKLKPLIRWPDRDALTKTMPMVFRKHFPSCIVIIDCFEIFLDRPTNLLARAQTYSSYKHHNTVKHLIGMVLLALFQMAGVEEPVTSLSQNIVNFTTISYQETLFWQIVVLT